MTNINNSYRGIQLIEGSLEVKLLTYGQVQQQVWEESARRKKIQVPEKVEKSGNTDFFPVIARNPRFEFLCCEFGGVSWLTFWLICLLPKDQRGGKELRESNSKELKDSKSSGDFRDKGSDSDRSLAGSPLDFFDSQGPG